MKIFFFFLICVILGSCSALDKPEDKKLDNSVLLGTWISTSDYGESAGKAYILFKVDGTFEIKDVPRDVLFRFGIKEGKSTSVVSGYGTWNTFYQSKTVEMNFTKPLSVDGLIVEIQGVSTGLQYTYEVKSQSDILFTYLGDPDSRNLFKFSKATK